MTALDSARPNRPIRVAVVAGDDRVRTSLRHLLTSGGDTVVVEAYTAGPRPETTSPAVGTDSDVVVMDLDAAASMDPGEQLRALPTGTPVVVLGNDRGTADAARAAGAAYLDKADAASQLLQSVVVAAGRGGTTHR